MKDIQLSCKEPFRLTADARENSKRLLCGLFCVGIQSDLEVSMVTPLNNDRGKGDVKKIRVRGETGEKEEVMVRHGIVPRDGNSGIMRFSYANGAGLFSPINGKGI